MHMAVDQTRQHELRRKIDDDGICRQVERGRGFQAVVHRDDATVANHEGARPARGRAGAVEQATCVDQLRLKGRDRSSVAIGSVQTGWRAYYGQRQHRSTAC
jgi:hypothetical protein